jgi:hypothetical protein
MSKSTPLLTPACDPLLRIDKSDPKIGGTVIANYTKLEKKAGPGKPIRHYRGGLSVTLPDGFKRTRFFTIHKSVDDDGSGSGETCSIYCPGFTNGFDLERRRVRDLYGIDLTPRRGGCDSYDPKGDGKPTVNFDQLEDRQRLGLAYEIEAAREGPGLVFDHCMEIIEAIHAALRKHDKGKNGYKRRPKSLYVQLGPNELCIDSILPYGLGVDGSERCDDPALHPGLNVARHPDVVDAISDYFEEAKLVHYRNNPEASRKNRGKTIESRKAGMTWMSRGEVPGIFAVKAYRKDDDRHGWTAQRSEFEALDPAALIEMSEKKLRCYEGERDKFIRLYRMLFPVALHHLHALFDRISFEHTPKVRHAVLCELLRCELPLNWFAVQKLVLDTGSMEHLAEVINYREIRKLTKRGIAARDEDNRLVFGTAVDDALGTNTVDDSDDSEVPWARFYDEAPETTGKSTTRKRKTKGKNPKKQRKRAKQC